MRPIPRFPSDRTQDDRRTSRRWTAGLLAAHLLAVSIAIGITYLGSPTSQDGPTQMARMKPAAGLVTIPPAKPLVRP